MELTDQQREAIKAKILEIQQAQADFVKTANERIAYLNGRLQALEELLAEEAQRAVQEEE
mgnify:CR=1 FL=1